MPTPERVTLAEYKELLKGHGRKPTRAATANRSFPLQAPKQERVARDAPAAAKQAHRFHSQVDVVYVHYRHRLIDPDNLEPKYLNDGLVTGGVLADDSAKEIREVRNQQVKIPKDQEEEVLIHIVVVQPEGRMIF